MKKDERIIKSITDSQSTAISRWAKFGPYYAMFPIEFACKVVSKFSNPGDIIIDPFAGRGSSIFAAAALKRKGIGIEINPVGWIYSCVKLSPAPMQKVLERLDSILELADGYHEEVGNLEEFYHMCFSNNVLRFLLSVKHNLDWECSLIDKTLMAFILLYLHGKCGQSLSNQMPMTKSTSKIYSIKWWKENGMTTPPNINIRDFFLKRLYWRYAKGTFNTEDAHVIYGDSTTELKEESFIRKFNHSAKLLFTSPPYYGITNYFADQWLRMWLLEDRYNVISNQYSRRFDSRPEYEELLDAVFGACVKLLADDATIYVRTDARDYTLQTTQDTLQRYFPGHAQRKKTTKCKKVSQTELLGNTDKKPCEVDIILTR